jgi:hypothetical protein
MRHIPWMTLLVLVTFVPSSTADDQRSKFPIPTGASVQLMPGGDGASLQEAHRLVKEEKWNLSYAAEYLVVVLKSDMPDPLERVTYSSPVKLQQEISLKSSTGAAKFHCYIFELQEEPPASNVPLAGSAEGSARPSSAQILSRLSHDRWDVTKK